MNQSKVGNWVWIWVSEGIDSKLLDKSSDRVRGVRGEDGEVEIWG